MSRRGSLASCKSFGSSNIRLKNVEIVLEGDKKIYRMGEKVHGKIMVTFNGDLPLSTLQIGVVGMTKVRHSDDTFHQRKLLENFYELPKSVTTQTLRTGTHEIPFRFPLPSDGETPPSFDGRYGCVNYFVECIIEDEEIHRTGVEIILEDPIVKHLLLTVSGSSEKDLGLFCIGSGNCSIEATISRKGHIAGEKIQVRALIHNLTSLKVQPRVSLYQTQIFMTGERHRTLELVLGEPVHGEEVDSNEVTEETLLLPIPETAQLTIKSSIITVKYFVHVTLDIPHNIDLHINLPIVVTTRAALAAAFEAPDDDNVSDNSAHASNPKPSTPGSNSSGLNSPMIKKKICRKGSARRSLKKRFGTRNHSLSSTEIED